MQNNREILLSIIVPVYNVEDYIEECLNSIVSQLNSKVELIIVNDGTEDRSIELISHFIKSPYIQLIEQSNSGLAAARNAGFKMATGNYIYFVDSDDYICEGAISKLLNLLYETKSELILTDFLMLDENSNSMFSVFNEFEVEQPIDFLNKVKSPLSHVWKYVVNRGFLMRHNISFRHGALCEDLEWLTKIYLNKPSVSLTGFNLYVYRKNRIGSIMMTVSEKRLKDVFMAIKEIDKYISLNQKRDVQLEKSIKKVLFKEFLYSLSFVCYLTSDEQKRIKNNIYVFQKDYAFLSVYYMVKIIGILNFSKLLNFAKKIKN